MPEPLPMSEAMAGHLTRAFAAYGQPLAVIDAEPGLFEGPVLFTNGAFARLTGREEGALLGRAYGSLRESLGEALARETGTIDAEVSFSVSAGRLKISAVPLFDHLGILRFWAIFHWGQEDLAPPSAATDSTGGFEKLLDGAAAALIVHRAFKPLYANREAARLFGYASPQDLLKEPTLLRHLPVDRLGRFLKRGMEGSSNRSSRDAFIARCLDVSGAGTWLEISHSEVDWADEPAQAVNLLDAQDKIRARRNEALLREAIDTISDSFILYDRDDRVVLTNRSFHEAFPFVAAQEEIAGTPMFDLVRASVANGVVTDPTLREDNAEAWIEEFIAKRHRNKSNIAEDTWPSGRWDLVKENRLESGGFVSIRTDITERKQAEFALKRHETKLEEALEERTKHLEAVLSKVAQGIVVLDSDLRVVLTNTGLHELVGYPKELGRPGTHVSELIRDRLNHGLFLPGELEAGMDAEEIVEHRLEAYRTLTRQKYRHVFPNGRLVEILRERLPDGMIICTFTDVTDQARAEEELERQREALYQSEKLSALGMLLAGVAHELNNPLQVVLGQATLLEGLCQDETRRERAGRIRLAAERCAKIVKTFLAMARDEPASRAPLRLDALIEGAVDFCAYQLKQNKIEATLDLEPDLPQVMGDRDQLNQILVNLLINAMQAMESVDGPRRLVVAARRLPDIDQVEFTVCDTGPGVPAELRTRIFDPFFTTKRVGVGTGVGLAVCHGMVTAHGGTISVDAGPDGGARFRVRLPAAGAQSRTGDGGGAVRATKAGGRILVVDDEAEICELLREFLRAPGREIDTVESGHAALELLARNDYDAVVCDLRMPGLDGQGLYETMAERRPSTLSRFIFATGDLLGADSQGFLAETGRPCLEKPFQPEQVRQVVGEVLQGITAPRRVAE